MNDLTNRQVNDTVSHVMTALLRNCNDSEECWHRMYIAVCASKNILENSPWVTEFSISPGLMAELEAIGNKIGKEVADSADKDLDIAKH